MSVSVLVSTGVFHAYQHEGLGIMQMVERVGENLFLDLCTVNNHQDEVLNHYDFRNLEMPFFQRSCPGDDMQFRRGIHIRDPDGTCRLNLDPSKEGLVHKYLVEMKEYICPHFTTACKDLWDHTIDERVEAGVSTCEMVQT
jgi:hypothetical protein